MKQKKRVVGFSIVALCVLAFVLCGGTTLISNVVSRLIDGNAGGEGTAIADPLDKVTCIVGDSDHNETFDVRDLVRLERYFGNVEEDLVTNDCSLDGDWNVSGDLDDSEKATIYDYERIYNGDAEICLQMLVEDPPSLQVTAIEEKYYKQIQDETGRCAYYTLNKAFKEGWVLTFKIDFKENPANSCSVSAYYPGCEEWLYLGEQGQGEYVVVATEYIPNLQIRVSNHSKAESVTDFRVYDIQVVKHEYIDDLEIVYNEDLYTNNTAYTNVPQMPIVYGTQDTLDMTKFAVRSDAVAEINAESEVVKYDWTLSYNGELVDGFDITNTEYTFGNIGTYTLTAKVVNNICSDDITDDIPNNFKANYSGEVSTTIKVVNPDVHINFNDTDSSKGLNIGSKEYYAGYYRLTTDESNFVERTDLPTQMVTGIDGEAKGSLNVRHNLSGGTAGPNSAYAVVRDYAFGTADFVISSWFYIPTGQSIGNNAGTYLFGIAAPGADSGFSVCLKQPTTGSYALRFKLLGESDKNPSVPFKFDRWNNVVLCRQGNSLELYYNGEMVYKVELTSDQSFGTAYLSFGGYPGHTTSYANSMTRFDDIQVYGGELSADDKQLLVAPKAVKPDVEVRYNDGTIENTGTDRSVGANAYQLKDDGSEFIAYTDPVNYTTGIYGEKDGAIVTNYQQAPYTVIKDYPFGTNNFTVSTWFKIPDARGLSGDLTAYLLGTANPKDTESTGFYVTISDGGALQLGVNGSAEPETVQEFKANTWYNLVVCRSGDSLLFYLNGTQIHEAKGIATTDFGTKDIAFGAYTGSVATEYKNTKVHFDNIEVYKAAKTEEQIKYIVDSVTKRPDVYVSFDDTIVTNEGTNVDVIADTYGLDQRANSTMFIKQVVGSVENTGYVTGFDKTNTALNTYHKDGPYTVARDYVFGKENFTISTWFKVPSDQITTFNNSAGIYLFGTDHSDATEDFSVCIKSNDTSTQQLRVKILDQDPQFINLGKKGKYQVALDEWYHLTLMREGGTIQVFLDDELRGVYEIDENHDFGTTDLAFGGYYGFAKEYSDSYKHFDEVEVYKGALQGDIEQMVATTSSKIPDVAINYTGGIVKNYGRVNYNAYAALIGTDESSNPAFIPTSQVTFTTGMEGDENGAISMAHDTGAYTVVEGYKFNSGDFTISLCFNVPIDNSQKLPNNDTVYLFGTTASGGNASANGFSVCLKENNSNQYGFRFQVGSVTSEAWGIDFKRGTWNNLVLRRSGDNLYLYLNGVQVDANGKDVEGNVRSIAGQDFGVADLAFGGYYGKSNYNGNQMYFDNIQVNSEAFTEEYIKYAKTAADYRVDWALDKNLDMTTLFVGDGFFSPEVLTELGYADKAVKLAGIEGTTTYDWDMFADSYLTFTNPKNLVVHLGQHNIYDDGDSAATTIQNLKSLLIKIHKIGSYLNTQIYYCGIPHGSDATKNAEIDQVNTAMKTWCESFRWITYVDAADAADDYTSVKTALNDVIVDNGLNFEAGTTYRTTSTLNPTAKTFSTWLYLPTDFKDSSRGGVIWSTYKMDKIPHAGFEIYQNGKPRFLHVPAEGADYKTDMRFNVDVRDTGWVNLTFVIEDEYTVACYMNGEFKDRQTTDFAIDLEDVTSVYTLGGNLTESNELYFKGRIREVALYENALDKNQVADLFNSGLDATTVKPFTYYQLQTATEGQDIADKYNKYNLKARGRFYEDESKVTDYDYSFAVIGDPQIVSINDNKYGNSNLPKIYDWIVNNKTDKNIQYVFNMGDITDGNLTAEWTAAQTQNAKLNNAGIPYSVLRGNHDLVGYNRKTTDDDYTTDHFTNYMGTEAYRNQFATGGFYNPDGVEKPDISNSWRTFTVGETDYLFLTLDYGVVSDITAKNATAANKLKADAILAWAGKVISQHPTHKVILTTHAYMNYDGTTLDKKDASNPSEGYGTYDGDYLWDNFVSQYGNIVLVMSGHIDSEEVVIEQRSDTKYGNTVTSMLINFQGVDRYEELTGMVTMLYFSNGGKTIQVENIATAQGDKMYFLEKNQFTIDIEDEIVVAPAVDIDFTGGTIANNTYSSLILAQYHLNTDKTFKEVTGEALFTTGRDGVANGALRLRHSLDYTNNDNQLVDGGAYVAVKGYDFGTDDFTLSTWFRLPGQQEVDTGASSYLFGTNNPDANSGFSVCLKQEGIRIKAGEKAQKTETLTKGAYGNDVWNQLVLCRRGGYLYLYLNGQSLLDGGYEIGEDYSFTPADLVFGGYSNWANNYRNNVMDYDDIQVYHTGMTDSQITAWYNNKK